MKSVKISLLTILLVSLCCKNFGTTLPAETSNESFKVLDLTNAKLEWNEEIGCLEGTIPKSRTFSSNNPEVGPINDPKNP